MRTLIRHFQPVVHNLAKRGGWLKGNVWKRPGAPGPATMSVPKPTPGSAKPPPDYSAQIAADKAAESAALAAMLAALETHNAELAAAQEAQDAARERRALAAYQATQEAILQAMEDHTGELHAMYRVPPSGSPLPRFAWGQIPANVDDLIKSELKQWLADYAYPDAVAEAAKHQLGDYTAEQLRSMIRGDMPLPVIVAAPVPAPAEARAPIPVPVSIPPLAGIAEGTAMDQFMVMSKDEILDWIIANWYGGVEALRPSLAAYDVGELITMIAERSGV